MFSLYINCGIYMYICTIYIYMCIYIHYIYCVCVCICVYYKLVIYCPFNGLLVISSPGPLQIKHMQTFFYKTLCGHIFSSFLG